MARLFNVLKQQRIAYVIVVKVKLSLCLTNYVLRHEGVWGSGRIDPHFLELGTSWSGQLHTPAALPPRKEPQYPMDRRFGGPQSRSGRHGDVTILAPTWTRTPATCSSIP
jgi:hypothetical protein